MDELRYGRAETWWVESTGLAFEVLWFPGLGQVVNWDEETTIWLEGSTLEADLEGFVRSAPTNASRRGRRASPDTTPGHVLL